MKPLTYASWNILDPQPDICTEVLLRMHGLVKVATKKAVDRYRSFPPELLLQRHCWLPVILTYYFQGCTFWCTIAAQLKNQEN